MSRASAPPAWLAGRPTGLLVWALEPYFGGSHRDFLEGFQKFSRHAVELETLPGRHWKWRMHGGAPRLAERSWTAGPAPQVLLASSMLDLPTYLALARPDLADVPTVLYFHENQLTYPLPPGVDRDLGYAFKQLSGAARADRVFFNSAFHRREFLQAARELLPSLPDEPPEALVERVAARSEVLPLACDLRRFDRFRDAGLRDGAAGRWGDPARGPLLVWNQRWEYDKAPGALFRALYALEERGVDYRLALAGPNAGLPSAEFVEARERLAHRIVHWGKAEDLADYASLLWAGDLVVSTALHEFFGIAVTEAVYCGCRPLLPRRLSYPELLPVEVHADCLYDEGELVERLVGALTRPPGWSPDWQRTWMARFDWGVLGPRYDQELWQTWQDGTPRSQSRG